MIPEATIIMGHGGGPLAPWIVKKHENVYMDTSFSNPDLAELEMGTLAPVIGHSIIDKNIVKMVGAEKILFGTDADPELLHFYKRAIDYVHNLEIGDEEKALILGGNAKRILGLV